MSKQTTALFSKSARMVSGALMLLTVLLIGGEANARPEMRHADITVTALAGAPECLSCDVLKQHKIKQHRCTHGAHARFVFNLMRSSPRAFGGASSAFFQRADTSIDVGAVAKLNSCDTRAARFDETFKSTYAKTRRMQP
jgi:hypothetical protein